MDSTKDTSPGNIDNDATNWHTPEATAEIRSNVQGVTDKQKSIQAWTSSSHIHGCLTQAFKDKISAKVRTVLVIS